MQRPRSHAMKLQGAILELLRDYGRQTLEQIITDAAVVAAAASVVAEQKSRRETTAKAIRFYLRKAVGYQYVQRLDGFYSWRRDPQRKTYGVSDDVREALMYGPATRVTLTAQVSQYTPRQVTTAIHSLIRKGAARADRRDGVITYSLVDQGVGHG